MEIASMTYFRKAVLKVGKYESPDGTVVVTPQRLQHWRNNVRRIQEQGYAIPMHWDHDDDPEAMEPIKLNTLKQNEHRSAKNTVGKLVGFNVARDGKSAELTIETLTKSATEKAASNAVYVSPVIFSEWTDGAGNVYTDTIGSVDLVDYPVDHSQGPFEPAESTRMSCCVRMSANRNKTYRLGNNPFDKKKKDGEYDSGDSSMGSDDDSVQESQEASETQSEPAEDFTAGPEPSGSDGMDPTQTATSVSDVVSLLAQLQVVLPDDTTTANFLERLRPALMTAIAAQAQPEEPQLADQLPPEQDPTMAQNPQIAAMSLRIRELERSRIEAGRTDLKKRLDRCLHTGRVTPNEHAVLSKRLGTQKMSLTKANSVHGGEVETWIQSREATPKGSCWNADIKTRRLSTVTAPEEYTTKDKPTQKQKDEAVQLLLKRHQ